ncbi:MAG TPA: Fur family transcriptional regulator [Acidimicrobiales bacterium]|nr:Fur family transcriptional regulator [Acidimicrobiales bacterium]
MTTPVAADRLRGAGLRATRPRVAVLVTLDRLGGHRSADELVAVLGSVEAGGGVPRSTVFAVLDDLVRAGLVTRVEVEAGPVRHEVASGRHHHLVCVACGDIVDVPCAAVAPGPCLEASVPGAELDAADVVLRGRCAACVAAGRRRAGSA